MSADTGRSPFRGIYEEIERVAALEISGSVLAVDASVLKLSLPGGTLNTRIRIERGRETRNDSPLLAQIVGIEGNICLASPLGSVAGVRAGARVTPALHESAVTVGPHLLGSALDSSGKVLSHFASIEELRNSTGNPSSLPEAIREVHRPPPPPLTRRPITVPFVSGIRAIDGFCTVGCGQRLGIFAEPGVGKSSLLGALAHSSSADVAIVALIGERGREIREFIEKNLSERGKARTIVVFSTSDEPALARINASLVALSIAEYFRDHGLHVLFLVDSLTRLCRAYREVGLIAGESPVRRGYTPSVFSRLPEFIERAGNSERGSITAMYTVLLSGELDEDPMVEEIKSLTDGHIVLRKQLAERGQFPAIDVSNSLSRSAHQLIDERMRRAAARVRAMLSRLERDRDLILFGGTADRELKEALDCEPRILSFLKQQDFESSDFEETRQRLFEFDAVPASS